MLWVTTQLELEILNVLNALLDSVATIPLLLPLLVLLVTTPSSVNFLAPSVPQVILVK